MTRPIVIAMKQHDQKAYDSVEYHVVLHSGIEAIVV